MASFGFRLLLVCLVLSSPAIAQEVPDFKGQEILVKKTLVSFSDANLTGNYSVFHATLSEPFRVQYSPEKLKETFKQLASYKVDFSFVVAAPMSETTMTITDSGPFRIKGNFDGPTKVVYELGFMQSEGEWKIYDIKVDFKKTIKYQSSK